MAERKTIAEMIGELFRETAVLLLVFVPLEVAVSLHFTLDWLQATLLVGSTMFSCAVLETVGIIVERMRGL